jgi:hypothetical protein
VGRRRVALEETLVDACQQPDSKSENVSSDRFKRTPYLFTFCPPGPEERENVISDRLRGMVSGFRSASHLRAAIRSSSE